MTSKTQRTIHPAGGGTFRRTAGGALTQVEKSTSPSPGKTALRQQQETASTGKRKAPADTKQENGNG
jgi:hypothetical protein